MCAHAISIRVRRTRFFALQFQIIEIAFAMAVNFVLAHWLGTRDFQLDEQSHLWVEFEHGPHSIAQQGDGSN